MGTHLNTCKGQAKISQVNSLIGKTQAQTQITHFLNR